MHGWSLFWTSCLSDWTNILFVHFITDSFLNYSQFAAGFSKYQLNLSLQHQVIVLELYTDKLRDLARVSNYHTLTDCCNWLHWFIFFCLRLKHIWWCWPSWAPKQTSHMLCVWIRCKEAHQSQKWAFTCTSRRGNAPWLECEYEDGKWKIFTNIWTFCWKNLHKLTSRNNIKNTFHDPFKPTECLSSYTASVIRCEDCLCASQLKWRVLRVHIILSEKERRMMLGETWALSQQMSQLGMLCCVSCWWGVTALCWECALNEAQLSAHVPIWP